MTTLIHGLQDRDGRFGLETVCAAGGQGWRWCSNGSRERQAQPRRSFLRIFPLALRGNSWSTTNPRGTLKLASLSRQ
ncbi:MAG: hypothetical protein ACRDRN_05405 [Sciscionella sp.]